MVRRSWLNTWLCRPRVLVASLLLAICLVPQHSAGQNRPLAPREESPSSRDARGLRFVRSGDRLLRTASYTSQEVEPVAEDLSEVVVEDGGEFAGEPTGVGSCDSPCGACPRCRMGRLWGRAEFLLWGIDGYHVPPLVTTSPVGTSRDIAGELGRPTTSILFGNEDLGGEIYHGARFRLGYWFDPCETYGLEASYFGLAQKTSTFSAQSSDTPILTRPFFNIEPGHEGQDAELVSYPGLLADHIQVRSQTQMQGVEVLYRQALCQDCTRRVDWLAGYRYVQLDDKLVISDFKRFVAADTGLQVGTTIEEFDRFATLNEFHGGELGVVVELRHCRWSLEMLGKLAVGTSRSQVTINGSTTVTVPDPDVSTTPYGLLALPSNSGIHTRDSLAVIPELGITLGYNFTPQLRGTVGYTFLYWSQVARPGDQIDLDLNLSQLKPGGLVGPARPEFTWTNTDVWAQGLSLGLDYRF